MATDRGESFLMVDSEGDPPQNGNGGTSNSEYHSHVERTKGRELIPAKYNNGYNEGGRNEASNSYNTQNGHSNSAENRNSNRSHNSYGNNYSNSSENRNHSSYDNRYSNNSGDYQHTGIGYINPAHGISSHYGGGHGIESIHRGSISSQHGDQSKFNDHLKNGNQKGSSMEGLDINSMIQSALPQITELIKGETNMSQDALGTAALAALVGRNDSGGGVGGLGSGILGGALGALLLSGLGGRGLGGGLGAGVAETAAITGAATIESQLAINNAVAAIKDHNGSIKGTIAELFAQHQQAEVVKGIDDKLANMHAHINSQVGHLSTKLEEVQSFLTLQQKDAEIHALRAKTEDYAQQLSEQRMVNLFKQAQEHVTVQVRNSHYGINNTVRAILPLLVPAAAGGGTSISVDRVTQIVEALSAFGQSQENINSVNVSA